VRESAHWGDVLLGEIGLSSGVVLGSESFGLAHMVDSLADLSSVMVTHLTSSGNGPGDSGWMPSSNTSDLSVTSMGLLWQELWSPSLDDTLETVSLGSTDDVEETASLEYIADVDFLLEELDSEVDLVGDLASVDLDFEDVSLSDAEVSDELRLVVADGSDDGAVLLDSGKLDLLYQFL